MPGQGVPHPRSGQGVPHPRSGWWGVPEVPPPARYGIMGDTQGTPHHDWMGIPPTMTGWGTPPHQHSEHLLRGG